MRKLWSSITKGKEPEPEAPAPRPTTQTASKGGKVEEVERRLAQLRATGAGPAQPPATEAPRGATRRTSPPRRGPSAAVPRGPAPPPLPSSLPELDMADLIVEPEAAPAEEAPLVLTEEPEDLAGEDAGRFESPSQPPVRPRRLRLGEVLIQRHLITQQQLEAALGEQRKTGERLGSALVSLGIISVEAMVSALAEQLGVEVILQERVEIDPSARDVLPLDVIRRHEVVPLWANDQVLRIAMADPTDLSIIDEIRFRSGRWVQVVLAAEATVRALIAGTFSTSSLMSEIKDDGAPPAAPEPAPAEAKEDDKDSIYDLVHESTGKPVINFVDFLLTDSVKRRASDVHIEPYEGSFRVRFRINGTLQTVVSPPPRLHGPVIGRLKVMAHMDTTQQRGPLEGHLALRYAGRELHYRLSVLPTVHGEKAVLHLLTWEADRAELADLSRIGLPAEEEARLRKAIAAPQGLVLLSGPLGSGTTTTAYAALRARCDAAISVATLEDPVEATLPGVTHVQIDEGGGVSFAEGLRSLLHQDPDVVFVGDLRDAEVAGIVLRASLGGRLVLSALDADGVLECFERLDELGAPRSLVAPATQAVVGQRLLKRVCEKCAAPVAPAELGGLFGDLPGLDGMRRRMAELGLPETFQRGAGCDECARSGYHRGVAVFEVLPVDRQLRELLRRKAPREALAAAMAERGVRTLYDNALRAASQGATTLSEVHRVLAAID